MIGPYAGLPGLKPTAKARGLSLAQVAARVGVHPTHLSLVATGRRMISAALAARLVAPDVLGCRWGDLQPFYARTAPPDGGTGAACGGLGSTLKGGAPPKACIAPVDPTTCVLAAPRRAASAGVSLILPHQEAARDHR